MTNNPATERLAAELQAYLAAQLTRLALETGRRLGRTTVRLNDIAEGNSPGLTKLALESGKKLAEGKTPSRAAFEAGAGHLKDTVKDKVKGVFSNLGGGKRKKGGGGQKPIVILEQIDVGVPVRVAYDQWTKFQDFSTFAKGVKSVTVADDTQSDWKMKVFWSNRSWKAHTTEQIPDQRITWTSEGAKGTTKGVVTFHSLGENLTRIALVMEYYPKGLFEKTGNIWRAQGRRARLDLKNFARHISLLGEAEDGWRGEIRDGEVVRTHEDAVAEEERPEDEEDDLAEDEYAEGEEEEELPEEEAEEAEDETEDEYEDEDVPEDEDAEEEAYEEEDEDAYETARR
ncbi:SRPBCC family protein [Streptomyces sp. A7024]|uniref:SRPBCC family protein n=1 Tax=Streptomyces coryli TaxID=1128680 RepID=A0A6G4U2Y4_9ACTN|nr:SRPBCC family protein [Streptomyces coryli]